MSEYFVSITVKVEANDLDHACELADEIVEQIEDRVSHAYDVSHWCIEEQEE